MAEETTPQEEAQQEVQQSDEQQELHFELNELVIIREDFHSKYFQGLRATIASPSRKGRNGETLWTLKLEKPPHEMVIAGKYLRKVTEADLAPTDSSGNGSSEKKGSFLSRLVPWRRS